MLWQVYRLQAPIDQVWMGTIVVVAVIVGAIAIVEIARMLRARPGTIWPDDEAELPPGLELLEGPNEARQRATLSAVIDLHLAKHRQ